MEKTNVMVEFRILGDDFRPDDVTDKLSIKPNYHWLNGDKINNTSIVRKYSCWAISTGCEESLDINDQLTKIAELIKVNKQNLIELKGKYELDYRIDIIINIESNEKPAIYLNSDVIELANEIKAEFDFDLYIY